MEELELKVILTKKEYSFLAHVFKFFDIKSVEQFNHYYDDTDKSYNKSGITCRIREKNNDYVATVKYHRGRGYATEYKRKVINQYDCSLFSGMDIFYQGVLRTNRIVFEPVYGIKMMLDENTYLDNVDYELEIEYIKEMGRIALKILKSISIFLQHMGVVKDSSEFYKRHKNSKTKSERFYERKSSEKGERVS